MKIEFSFQRREMLSFMTANMAAVTSRALCTFIYFLMAFCLLHSMDTT